MKKGVNILFTGVGGELRVDSVKRIIQKYEIENAYAVVSDKDMILPEFKEVLWFWDVVNGKYPYEDEQPSLDEAILYEYNQYCFEAMFMMERDGERYDSFASREKLYYAHLRFWSFAIKKWELQCVFFETLPHEVYDVMLYHMCKKKNIEVYMLYKTPITYSSCVMKSIDEQGWLISPEYERLKQEYKMISEDKIKLSSWAEEYYNRMKSLDGEKMRPVVFKNNMREITLKRTYYVSTKDLIKEWKNDSEKCNNLKSMIRVVKNIYVMKKYYWRGKQETKELVQYYDKKAVVPNLQGKYIFYGLHYQPELMCTPLGGAFMNQLLAIKCLSYNTPNDFKIYVKEHPAQIAFGRKKDFYDELLKIPKVYLVKENVTSYELIKNCFAVSSLTGTIGWESLFFGKPFIMFGTYQTQYIEGTYKVKTNRQCRDAIKEIENNYQPVPSKNLKLFVKAMDTFCYYDDDFDEKAWRQIEYALEQ